MLSEGQTDEDVRSFMKETYLASQEKIDLSCEIASREITLLSKLKTLVSAKRGIRDAHLGYSIYIGIPFCPTTCLYCSFPSYARASYTGKVQKYLDALKKEIREVSEIMKDRVLNTVYIGGGTPTALSAEELEELFSYLYEVLPMDSIAEFNVEAGRPDSITREKLEVMKKYKVSRISINPQTMNEKTLKLIGRHHSVESVRESFALAREMGFSNINMDLILGLPGETKKDVLYTFSEVEKMAPDSVTVHSLAVKTHSRLREQWEEYKGYVMENSSYLMQAANETAERLGLKPYYLYRQKQMVGNLENVGFAKPGLEGLYNILIMEEQQDIVALGAGTASKKVHMDGTTSRCENVKDVDTYIDRIDEMIERKRKLFS
jgi:oxygen-independent coproporphyrinogen-3 oxidase